MFGFENNVHGLRQKYESDQEWNAYSHVIEQMHYVISH